MIREEMMARMGSEEMLYWMALRIVENEEARDRASQQRVEGRLKG